MNLGRRGSTNREGEGGFITEEKPGERDNSEILDSELARAAKVKPAVADLSKGWILSPIRIFEIGLLV